MQLLAKDYIEKVFYVRVLGKTEMDMLCLAFVTHFMPLVSFYTH